MRSNGGRTRKVQKDRPSAIEIRDGRSSARSSGRRRAGIIVADHHEVTALGIRAALLAAAEFDAVRIVRSFDALMDALRTREWDVLVMDHEFGGDGGGAGGARLIEAILHERSDVRIVVYADHDEIVLVTHALRAGVLGFVSVSDECIELVHAVLAARDGGRYLSRRVSARMADDLGSDPGGEHRRNAKLSSRELEVMRLLVQGQSVAEIARNTQRSLKTISAQKVSAMKKLGVATDVELFAVVRWIP